MSNASAMPSQSAALPLNAGGILNWHTALCIEYALSFSEPRPLYAFIKSDGA
jgi:hypothetical protein